ncbi:MAG TPA: glycoside hydrolase family 2 TIM barrel-domain containing protein [Polyangia bacterium]
MLRVVLSSVPPVVPRLRAAKIAACLLLLLAPLGCAWLGAGRAPDRIATARGRSQDTLNDGWRFHRGDVPGAEASSFDDSAWTRVDVPHTWNALDGQDGPTTPYWRGVGWYRRRIDLSRTLAGKRLYLQFDGANTITDVWVNGKPAGTHRGGYSIFRFDVTELVALGGDNVVAVKVNNAAGVDDKHVIIPGSPTVDIAPLSADYTFYGGIYRGVFLLATPPLSISPLDFGSSGVYVKQTNVSAKNVDLAVTVKLANAEAAAINAQVKATVLDADGKPVLTLNAGQSVPGKSGVDVVAMGKLANPRLWNGLRDPYLYSVRVDLTDGGGVLDTVTVPLGVRWFSLDANKGFFLNGEYLDLRGVNKHQDQKDKGWAISDSDTVADFEVIKEIGATAVRLAHYQHAQHTYDLTDRLGYITWAENPVINRINDTPGFAASGEQQLIELIRQNYNHPSIAFWSVGNEVLLRPGPDPNALIKHLSEVAAREDSTRLVAYAANGKGTQPVNWHGQAHGFNEYQGWYGGKVDDFGKWADWIHAEHPNDPVAVTEYGAGANVTQHTADPASHDTGKNHTPLEHTEEYQAYYHEKYWAMMSARPFLWGKFIWNLFDFASDGRTEGDLPGLNDKGLVTFDRKIKKDAFYLYKANWSSDPFVHITSRRFATLPKATRTVRIYSNAPSVELKLNGKSLGSKTAADRIFVWTDVPWTAGANNLEASAVVEGKTVSDQVSFSN